MTYQQPGQYNPIPYGTPTPSTRPAAITVIAIIGIVFGSLGTLCLGFAAITAPFANSFQSSATPGFRQPTSMIAWNAGSSVVGMILSIVLLAGSIGALSLKSWSRGLLVGVSWVDIVWQLIKAAVGIVWVLPQMKTMIAQMSAQIPTSQPNPLNSPAMGSWMQTAGAIGIVGGLIIGLAFPIVTIIVMKRQNVRDAFEGKFAPAPPPGYPPPYNPG